MVDSLNTPVAQTPTATPTPAQPAITPSYTNTQRADIPDDYHIEIHDMTGDVLQRFRTGRLSKVFEEEDNGCGGSSSWTCIWDNNGHTLGSDIFNMPLGVKGGCVERAFMTAAKGPRLGKCVQKQSG